MERILNLTMIMLLTMAWSWTLAQPPIAVPDGYAGAAGTTGGGNATPMHARSAAEFTSAAGGDNPKVIVVHGGLDIGAFSVGSNTTIVGADESAGLRGGRINLNGANYILQNLIIGPSGPDAMEASGGTKIFVTKCTFHDASDELFSMVHGADHITVSWSKFYFDKSHGHAFVHLIGNSNGLGGEDRGKLHVTLHHNWYTKGAVGRMPRVRFGHVHLYNIYWNAEGTCIQTGVECHIRVESALFEKSRATWADYGGSSNGELGWKDLIFDGATPPTYMPNKFPVFEPPYAFHLDSAKNVRALVMAGAGNVKPTTVVAMDGRGKVIAYPVVGPYIVYEWSPRLQIKAFGSSKPGEAPIRRMDGRSIGTPRPYFDR